ncbi:SET domain-containing protein [Leptothoe spongobia TAU-MAC 1115]|uniref:SET domain-containing protein n=1 Tax=Leptothoe spongobia TAU-MAC 1115 TaxID=1967444 RepID=A0A947GEX0_9CYAN|nr:SET domain-containing protein [Leptothoe spongobia TAU-MAC 1115]
MSLAELIIRNTTKSISLHPIHLETTDIANDCQVILDEAQGAQSLIAKKNFAPGELLSRFYALDEFSQPSNDSLQIDETCHIGLYPTQLRYISHSCDPNVVFDIQAGEVICIKPIQAGEYITCFYPSTEWEVLDAFSCLCGSDQCLETIQGAKHLPIDILNRYELARHIRRLKRHQSLFSKAVQVSI